MRRFVDLHTHSTASDGTLAPAAVVARADAAQLAAVALTDHDTTAGLDEARKAATAYPELTFVPGVEVSARFTGGTMHILGLGVDENAPTIRAVLATFIEARRERNPKIIARLQALGVGIDMADVLAAAEQFEAGPSRVIGRVHIAQALRTKGHVGSISEAFERYLGDGKPAYVDKERLAPREVIEAIVSSGAAAVLAHPLQLGLGDGEELECHVARLVEFGLTAIEAYHSEHTDVQTRRFLDIAAGLGLAVTGGSDFHGSAKPTVDIGRPKVPLAALTGSLAELVAGGQ